MPVLKEEKGEEIGETEEQEYVYEDELEEERIEENFEFIIINLLEAVLREKSIKLSMLIESMRENYGDRILRNSDFYTLLIHMCGKNEYIVEKALEKPETFFEEYMARAVQREGTDKYSGLSFRVGNLEGEEINIPLAARISDVVIERTV